MYVRVYYKITTNNIVVLNNIHGLLTLCMCTHLYYSHHRNLKSRFQYTNYVRDCAVLTNNNMLIRSKPLHAMEGPRS